MNGRQSELARSDFPTGVALNADGTEVWFAEPDLKRRLMNAAARKRIGEAT
jgi:hypothetical protein